VLLHKRIPLSSKKPAAESAAPASASSPQINLEQLFKSATSDEKPAGGNPLEQLFSLSQHPEASKVMSSLGIDPAMAHSFLESLSGKSNQNDNNAKKEEEAPEILLCDECDLPIESIGNPQYFQCNKCDDFSLHENCALQCVHDPEHELLPKSFQ
jgi:hypothetical protein